MTKVDMQHGLMQYGKKYFLSSRSLKGWVYRIESWLPILFPSLLMSTPPEIPPFFARHRVLVLWEVVSTRGSGNHTDECFHS